VREEVVFRIALREHACPSTRGKESVLANFGLRLLPIQLSNSHAKSLRGCLRRPVAGFVSLLAKPGI
jgi:hypothetical protein